MRVNTLNSSINTCEEAWDAIGVAVALVKADDFDRAEVNGKAVALKRREQLNPERLSYHVMFADTALLDAGKKVVRDFICPP